MNILISTLKEELATSQRLEKKYLEQLKSHPQGSFVVRKVREKSYGYLTYRSEGKVKQRYLGAVDEETIKGYRAKVEEKKKVKQKLKSVRGQISILKKALRGKAK